MGAVSSQVAASPAYFGYTGLMMTPTADTLRSGGTAFNAVILNNNNNTSFLSANFGLMDSLEVGAAMISQDHGDSKGIVNGKFQLLKETTATPALAIGISDLADQLDSTLYIVGSKSLSGQWSPRLHVGVGSGRLNGLFAGLSATVSDRMQLMAEYDTNDLNFGLQFAATNSLRLHAGIIGGDHLGLGLSYNARF